MLWVLIPTFGEFAEKKNGRERRGFISLPLNLNKVKLECGTLPTLNLQNQIHLILAIITVIFIDLGGVLIY